MGCSFPLLPPPSRALSSAAYHKTSRMLRHDHSATCRRVYLLHITFTSIQLLYLLWALRGVGIGVGRETRAELPLYMANNRSKSESLKEKRALAHRSKPPSRNLRRQTYARTHTQSPEGVISRSLHIQDSLDIHDALESLSLSLPHTSHPMLHLSHNRFVQEHQVKEREFGSALHRHRQRHSLHTDKEDAAERPERGRETRLVKQQSVRATDNEKAKRSATNSGKERRGGEGRREGKSAKAGGRARV